MNQRHMNDNLDGWMVAIIVVAVVLVALFMWWFANLFGWLT